MKVATTGNMQAQINWGAIWHGPEPHTAPHPALGKHQLFQRDNACIRHPSERFLPVLRSLLFICLPDLLST